MKPKYKKYIRLGAGLLLFVLGGVFMMIPFIPLGYIFLIGSLFLLAYEIPALKRVLDKIKARDKKGRVEKVEQKLKDGERIVTEKLGDNKKDASSPAKSDE